MQAEERANAQQLGDALDREGTPLDLRLKILRPLANDADRIGALFARIDGNGDGEVDRAEFGLACLLALEDEAAIDRIFTQIDADGGGTICEAEFRAGFGLLQEEITKGRRTEEALRRQAAALETSSAQLMEELSGKREEVEVLEQGLQKATATKTENAELAANIYADNADLREELDAAREQITSLHQAMAQLVRKVSAAEVAEPPPVLVEL